jgi:hypothetical protein
MAGGGYETLGGRQNSPQRVVEEELGQPRRAGLSVEEEKPRPGDERKSDEEGEAVDGDTRSCGGERRP